MKRLKCQAVLSIPKAAVLYLHPIHSTEQMAETLYDIVVIGAFNRGLQLSSETFLTSGHIGLSGIAISRFYLDVHPTCTLSILEEYSCVGGVWSTDRPR